VPRLARVCVQFPDPWHDDNAARRVLTPALAAALAAALPPGGELFLVSDVLRVACEMRDVALAQGGFELHPLHATAGAPHGWEPGGGGGGAADAGADAAAELAAPPPGGWLRVRPYFEPTERDKVCEAKWRPVYRTLLVRR
jgi:tRNA (guanine-N7-)-methyltransferase